MFSGVAICQGLWRIGTKIRYSMVVAHVDNTSLHNLILCWKDHRFSCTVGTANFISTMNTESDSSKKIRWDLRVFQPTACTMLHRIQESPLVPLEHIMDKLEVEKSFADGLVKHNHESNKWILANRLFRQMTVTKVKSSEAKLVKVIFIENIIVQMLNIIAAMVIKYILREW